MKCKALGKRVKWNEWKIWDEKVSENFMRSENEKTLKRKREKAVNWETKWKSGVNELEKKSGGRKVEKRERR